jgi:hypothetical protein
VPHVVTELGKEGVSPLGPEKFAWVEVIDSSLSWETSVRGLHDATDQSYEWFCEHFMKCVIPTTKWKLLARKQRMSEYITPTLEALALLVYKNAFDKWNEEFLSKDNRSETSNGVHDSADGLSSLTGSRATHGFLFTGNSKGSRKYEGWNPAGMRFYNDVLCLIGEQCGRSTGCPFEQYLLHRLATRPKGGRRNEDEIQAPRANNHVDQLMQIVGL